MKNLSNIEHELDIVTKQYVDNAASAKVDKVEGKQLSTNDFTNEYKTKLEELNILQVSEIPAATEENAGQIIQYIGVTNDSYTNGFFYKNENLIWTNIKVQDGVSNYNELENKPTLNGIEIDGDKTAEDYGINNSNIHYGTETPTEENVVMWVDPSGAPVSILTTDNEIEYTPTGDYNPATKKYVDDALDNASTEGLIVLEASTDNIIDFNTLTEPGLYLIKNCNDLSDRTLNSGISNSEPNTGFDLTLDVRKTINSTTTTTYQTYAYQSGAFTKWRSHNSNSNTWLEWNFNNTPASYISAGIFAGRVQAQATASATLSNKQVRNITISSTDLTAGTSTLTTGDIYLVYE